MKWLESMNRAARAAVAALCLASVASAQQQPVNLTIGSFAQGSSWYVYAVNLGELLRAVLPPGSNVDTPPIAGGLGNPQLVASNKAQLAFGMAVVGNWALEGKHSFKEPLKDLRALVGGWDDYYLVPIARGAGQSADLAAFFKSVRPNARVTLLQRGSIGAYGGQQLLDIAGAGEKALADQGGNYEFGSFDMVKNRFAGGSGDVFVQVATLGHPSITEIAQSTPLTFLEPSKAVLEQMTKRFGWETAALPKGTFPGQTKEVLLPSTTTTLFTSTAMPDDLAYTITKAICERAEKMRAAHKALATFDCAKNQVWKREVNGLPLHAGAERYYRERGWIK
ncbi:MAG: TAXI family TRAP transporter solute-binding subunit [Burkholderiaceae bacterium]